MSGSHTLFPILTEQEQQALTSHAEFDSHLETLIQNLILVLDNGIVDKWYSVEGPDKNAEKYLTVAAKLKKPVPGEMEIKPASEPNGKAKKIFHFTYQNFWKSCYEKMIFRILSVLSYRHGDELLHPKLHVCSLMQFKVHVIPHLDLEDEQIERLQDAIDKLSQIYLKRINQTDAYCLSQDEVNEAKKLKEYYEISDNYFRMRDLKNALESFPLYARYCHIRPGILIQFAQLIAMVLQKIDEFEKAKSSWIFSNLALSAKVTPIKETLKKKQAEIAAVMHFQERLLLTFGFEDPIEILQCLVQSENLTILPKRELFNSNNDYISSLWGFLKNKSGIPARVTKQQYSAWRRDYIAQHTNNSEILPLALDELNEFLSRKNASQEHEAKNYKWIPLEEIPRVIPAQNRFEIIAVPKLLSSALFSSDVSSFALAISSLESLSPLKFFGRKSKIKSSALEVSHQLKMTAYHFFIDQFEDREKFYKVNNYFETYTKLSAQVESNADIKIHFQKTQDVEMAKKAIISKNGKPFILCKDSEIAFTSLGAILDLFNEEIMDAELAMQISDLTDRNIINLYANCIKEKRSKFIERVDDILKYWIEYIKDISTETFPPIILFNRVLKNCVMKFGNKNILDYFNHHVLANDLEKQDSDSQLVAFYQMQAK